MQGGIPCPQYVAHTSCPRTIFRSRPRNVSDCVPMGSDATLLTSRLPRIGQPSLSPIIQVPDSDMTESWGLETAWIWSMPLAEQKTGTNSQRNCRIQISARCFSGRERANKKWRGFLRRVFLVRFKVGLSSRFPFSLNMLLQYWFQHFRLFWTGSPNLSNKYWARWFKKSCVIASKGNRILSWRCSEEACLRRIFLFIHYLSCSVCMEMLLVFKIPLLPRVILKVSEVQKAVFGVICWSAPSLELQLALLRMFLAIPSSRSRPDYSPAPPTRAQIQLLLWHNLSNRYFLE